MVLSLRKREPVALLSCGCNCSVALPRGAVVLSMICICGIFLVILACFLLLFFFLFFFWGGGCREGGGQCYQGHKQKHSFRAPLTWTMNLFILVMKSVPVFNFFRHYF